MNSNPELWQFPCRIALKVIGDERDGFDRDVVCAVQSVIPGDYHCRAMPSRNGKYVSITVAVQLNDKNEVQALFAAARKVPGVHLVL